MLTFCERVLRGVNTMRPPSAFTSRVSPARRPSLRRTGPGRTTWPFVETLVSIVRQFYPNLSLRVIIGSVLIRMFVEWI